jgi:hypothetical protein
VETTKQKGERERSKRKNDERRGNKVILARKGYENHQAKRRKEKKTHTPKYEEHEGMPQLPHGSHAKRREDTNPKYHEEQQKNVA